MAAFLHGRGLEPVPGWSLGLVSRSWLHVGIGIPLGVDAVLLRKLAVRPRLRLVLESGLLEYLVSDATRRESSQQDSCTAASYPYRSDCDGRQGTDFVSRDQCSAPYDDQSRIGWAGNSAWIGAQP